MTAMYRGYASAPGTPPPRSRGADIEVGGEEQRGPTEAACVTRRSWRFFALAGALQGLIIVGAILIAILTHRNRQGRLAGDSASELFSAATRLDDNPCASFPYLRLEKLVQNNLGGKGPDRGEEGLVFKAVDVARSVHRPVLLKVNAKSGYRPWDSKDNGFSGEYASINLVSGSSVDLEISLRHVDTDDLVHLPVGALTFFDLNTGKNNTSIESVTISGFEEAKLSMSSELMQSKNGDGTSAFSGSTYGSSDNPTDLQFLTEQQRSRAVTLMFKDLDRPIPVTLSATAGVGPRSFTFAGRPSVLCAAKVEPEMSRAVV